MTELVPELYDDTAGPAILDAASILLVDKAQGAPRVLMGLRQASNVFLPSKWVFPGGRLEAGDGKALCTGTLDPGDAYALRQRLLPARDAQTLPQALAYAAVRELLEETGHALAERHYGLPPREPLDEPAWTAWRGELRPSIEPLTFIARAITPPGRTRRYDTRFFIAPREHAMENAAAADGEFADLNWFTIADAQALDLPIITRRILTDLEEMLKGRENRAGVPFYYEHAGTYRRDLIARSAAPA